MWYTCQGKMELFVAIYIYQLIMFIKLINETKNISKM